MRSVILFVSLATMFFTAGCPVTQSQNTPADISRRVAPLTARKYYLYVPSYYTAARDWPLVVTLHGTHGWDSASAQAREWKHLAESQGLIVVAPTLKSSQGILPVVRKLWYKDLATDEQTVLGIVDEIGGEFNIDPNAILLTGFSAGGYPLYYIGLRNPERFSMLIARACNSDMKLLQSVELTDQARKMPIMIFNGKDDLKLIRNQSWRAFRYLRTNRCFATRRQEVNGGHLRRPKIAYDFWLPFLAKRHHR